MPVQSQGNAYVSCTAWGVSATGYDPSVNNTYRYSVDSNPLHTGSFGTSFSFSGFFVPGSGNHHLQGIIVDGHRVPNKAPLTYPFTLDTSGCSTTQTKTPVVSVSRGPAHNAHHNNISHPDVMLVLSFLFAAGRIAFRRLF